MQIFRRPTLPAKGQRSRTNARFRDPVSEIAYSILSAKTPPIRTSMNACSASMDAGAHRRVGLAAVLMAKWECANSNQRTDAQPIQTNPLINVIAASKLKPLNRKVGKQPVVHQAAACPFQVAKWGLPRCRKTDAQWSTRWPSHPGLSSCSRGSGSGVENPKPTQFRSRRTNPTNWNRPGRRA